jgi:hypothetical protein
MLFLIILQAGGFLIVFHAKQISIYQSRHSKNYSASEIRKFSFTVSDFEKLKISDDEFVYEGNLYDVKNFSLSGEKIAISAINDKEESDIFNLINSVFNNEADDSSNVIIQLLCIFYLPVNNENIIPLMMAENGFSDREDFLLLNRAGDVLAPPPRDFTL